MSARRVNLTHVRDEKNNYWELINEFNRFPGAVCMQDNWKLVNRDDMDNYGEVDCLCCFNYAARVLQLILLGELETLSDEIRRLS